MNIEQARFNMVEQQIRPCEIFNEKLLDLLIQVKREDFVPVAYKNIAFSDVEIPLPGGQKTLLPRVIAKLIQELAPKTTDKVLEIATGNGYVTALLAKMSDFVYSIEKSKTNLQLAINNLTHASINNVSVINADGTVGLEDKAPFNKIFVGGAFMTIPETLKTQLKIGGILVGFVGNKQVMHAIKIVRNSENNFIQTNLFETSVEYLENVPTEQFKF